MSRPAPHRLRQRTRAATLSCIALSVGAVTLVPLTLQSADAAELTAPVFAVVAEGLTPDQGARLAEQAGIGNALRPDGSFSFRADSFAQVPSKTVASGKDEKGNRTVSQAVDVDALKSIKVPDERAAAEKARALVAVAKPFAATTIVGHTTAEMVDAKDKPTLKQHLDTTVSFQTTLAGKPVVGPGAKLSVAFDGEGKVVQLTQATRQVKEAGSVAIISPDEATKLCAAQYGGARQKTPVLGYQAPALTAQKASGVGSVKQLLPTYICQPAASAEQGVDLSGRLIPAAPSLTPAVSASASYDGKTLSASASVKGGTGPYTYAWTSSTGSKLADGAARVSYAPTGRSGEPETLTLTVTDANGASSSVALTPSTKPGAPGKTSGSGVPGGLGGALAEVGIESPIGTWACAQNSANGFRNTMASKGQSIIFDWRGNNAWERDFRDPSLGGTDSTYVDNADIQWYTGHGSAGSFTMENTTKDDKWITPADASWGNTDLEWLNLESCQVLRDTNGLADYFGRWGPTMDGLHVMNGFDTNASCLSGTGGRFADYLFPETFLWWTVRDAKSISQAWASMATDLEPAGRRWRSMSLIGAGGVHDLNDRYWGQGTVGPDLFHASRTGMIAISGIS